MVQVCHVVLQAALWVGASQDKTNKTVEFKRVLGERNVYLKG